MCFFRFVLFRGVFTTLACSLDSDIFLHERYTLANTLDYDFSHERFTLAYIPDSDFLHEQLTLAGRMNSDSHIAGSSSEVPSTSSKRSLDEGTREQPSVKRGLYSCEIIDRWNLTRVNRELGTRQQCVVFAEQNGLVATEKLCRTHRISMKIANSTNENLGSWVCHKKTCRNISRKARTTGTFFENIKIDIRHVFYLIYAYAHGWSYDETIHEDPLKEEKGTCLSRATVGDWHNYCREVIVLYYIDKQENLGKIGGPGKVVQIDESKFGKRKYNRGRHIEGHWVLGMMEDGSEDLRLEVCPNNIRNANVLVPIIKKHVEVGTEIHTDCWKAYNSLMEHGYIHKTVNHSDPENPFVAIDGTHTQRIESQWRAIKRFFRKENYNNSQSFADIAVEYLWRRHMIKYKKDPFLDLIEAIKFVYKIT